MTWIRRTIPAAVAAGLSAVLGLTLLVTAVRAQTTAALWHMDDADEMTDSSGNGNSDGVLTDITLATPGFDGTGGAYEFNGTSSSVVVPDDDSLDPGSSDIDVTVHVKFDVLPDDTVGDYDLIRKKKGTAYKMEILRGGRPFCLFRGTLDRKALSMRRNLADGEWHTITCAKTSDSISLTVDGRTKSRLIAVGNIANAGSVIIGGKEGATGDWYLGLMDEVSITIA